MRTRARAQAHTLSQHVHTYTHTRATPYTTTHKTRYLADVFQFKGGRKAAGTQKEDEPAHAHSLSLTITRANNTSARTRTRTRFNSARAHIHTHTCANPYATAHKPRYLADVFQFKGGRKAAGTQKEDEPAEWQQEASTMLKRRWGPPRAHICA